MHTQITSRQARAYAPTHSTHGDPVALDLPLPDLFAVAGATPTVILAGRVHYLVPIPPPAGPSFWFDGGGFGLEPAQTFAELAQEYVGLTVDALDRAEMSHVESIVPRPATTDGCSYDPLAAATLRAFLEQQLIPVLIELNRGRAYVLDRSAGDLEPVERPTLVSRPDDRPRRIADLLRAEIGEDAVVLDDLCYPLIRTGRWSGLDMVVQQHGRYLRVGSDGRLLREIEAAVMAGVAAIVRESAQTEAARQLRAVGRAGAGPRRAALLPSVVDPAQTRDRYLYRDGVRGILYRQGTWTPYVEVPEYVVEDADGALYRFEATRIGIPLRSWQPDQLFVSGMARVLTAHEHMFVASPVPGASICMPRPARYYEVLRRMPPARAICQVLHDARQTLMAGHHAGNTNGPHHAISSFARRRIARHDAERWHLPIFPYVR